MGCIHVLSTVVFALFLSQFEIAASRFDNIKLENFKLGLSSESISVILNNPSRGIWHSEDLTAKLGAPISIGVQLQNHGIDLNSAKAIGNNKISFGDVTLGLRTVNSEPKCMEVSWESTKNVTLEDCFRLGPHNWYGGPEVINQYWPIEEATFDDYSYVTKDVGPEGFADISEPYWFNSDGLMVYVDPSVPLFIDQNNRRKDSLCLLAKNAAPYYRTGLGPILKYTVCKFDNPRTAHEYAIKTFLGKPTGIPDTRMVEHPIWSTWAKFRQNFDANIMLGFAKDINKYGFNNSQIEFDDAWETCYGSLTFDTTKFPDIKKLIMELNGLGFRTTAWVHPFINLNCASHQDAAARGYFVKNRENDVKTVWWNGEASSIDFTNPAAASWHEARLRATLATTGLDSYKFDAGESNFMPHLPVLNGPESEHPTLHTHTYVNFAAKFGGMVEVRTGRRNQHLPIYFRMMDRDSKWTLMSKGMPSVITATFQMNFNGYPFVLPDMVGGNKGEDDIVTKELFIRYLQMSVFLPVIQFSIAPWDFDAETVELSKKYTALHYEYSGKIVELMKKAVETGQPINPPIWWVDPTNKEAHPINSEYMLGEDILVAPVLKEGARQRDIYLPQGQWRDEAKPDKPTHQGPIWLRNYPAPLNTLPYFTRVPVSSGADRFSCLTVFLAVVALLPAVFN